MNNLQRVDPDQPINLAGYRPEPPRAEQGVTPADVWGVIRRRAWVVLLLVAVSLLAALLISLRTPKQWDGTQQLLLVQRAVVPTMASTPSPGNGPMIESIDTQNQLLQSQEIADRAIALLKQDATARGDSPDNIGIDAEQLQKSATITNPKDTNLIQLVVPGDSRTHAADWTDALARAFVNYKNEIAKKDSEDLLAALTVRANRAKQQMDDADQALLQYKKNKKLVDAGAQTTALLTQLNAQKAMVDGLSTDLHTEQARLASLQAQLNQANAQIKNGGGVPDDALVLSLQTKLNDLEMQRADAARRYTSKYPGVLPSLDAQIKDIKQRLASAIGRTVNPNNSTLSSHAALLQDYTQTKTAVIATQARLSAATQQRDRLQAESLKLPETDQQSGRLELTAQVARSTYSSLQSSLNQAQLERDQATGNVQTVLPHAYVPEAPSRPNTKRNLLVGGIVGILLSLAAVLLLEQGDRRIRNVDGVRKLADGPVIGLLPQLTPAQHAGLKSGDAPIALLEGLNVIRAGLALAFRRATGTSLWDHQILMVTSAVPGEGKSLVASELAKSLADAGKHVVLINADMRRPGMEKTFPAGDGPGLAELLSGEASLAEALVPSGKPRLTLIHAGQAGISPTQLLSLPEFPSLLATLRTICDVVVIDTPAASVVADSLLIAPHVDGVLYVVGAGLVDEPQVRETVEALESASPKFLGYLLNRAETPKSGAMREYASYYFQPPSGQNGHRPKETLVALPSGSPVPYLVGTEGLANGRRVAIVPNVGLTIGTRPESGLILSGDAMVSRSHARIEAEDGLFVLHDDGSTNGTLVNGVPVTRHILHDGDQIQIGKNQFRFQLQPDAVRPAPVRSEETV